MNAKYMTVVALCAVSLGGCMTAEERAQYEKEQRQARAEQVEQAKQAQIKAVENISDEVLLAGVAMNLEPKKVSWQFAGRHISIDWQPQVYSEEARIAALRKIKSPLRIMVCGICSAVGYDEGRRTILGCRQRNDTLWQEAAKMLSQLDYKQIIEAKNGLHFFSTALEKTLVFDQFADNNENDGRGSLAILCPQKWDDEQVQLLKNILTCEALALKPGQADLCRYAIENGIHSGYDRVDYAEYANMLTHADEKNIVNVFKKYYDDHEIYWAMKEKSEEIKRRKYIKGASKRVNADDLNPNKDVPQLAFVKLLMSKLKDTKCIREAVKHVALTRINHDDYAFLFEKEVIQKYRAEIIEMFGDDASLYPEKSNLARFASLLYTDEERKEKRAKVLAQRGTFNGVFGKKFGDVMPTDEGVRVTKFGADFYRVPFEPAKKSEAFTHYYVWLTPSSHKIFEIEARSDSALAFSRTEVEYKDKEGNAQKYQRNAAKPDVVFALEKKYCEYFMKQGEAYVLQFPEEKCHLSVIPNLAGAIAGGGRSGFVDLFMMNTFGFTADHEQEEKKIRRLKDYNFSSVEEKTRALVFAESAELYKLAKEETNAERTKQKKAAADKQKAAAQNAADAF